MFSFFGKKAFERIGAETTVSLRVVFPNRTEYRNHSSNDPQVSIIFKNTKGLWKAFLLGGAGIAIAYVNGDVELEGKINLFGRITWNYDLKHPQSKVSVLKFPDWVYNKYLNWKHNPRSIQTAKQNAIFHYNRGTALFQQYLDSTLMYTCAYWKDGTSTLEQAQIQKTDHVLKKLRLQPGQSLVDVGSGWGYLLIRAVEKYGVTGVNVSPTPDQNQYLQKQLKAKGLENKITIKQMDFREDNGVYDRYVSVGVYEHAGRDSHDEWIQCMARSLKPGGIGVLHWISGENANDAVSLFMKKYIFPGAYLPSLGEAVECMAKNNLEVLDVENLRRHYHFTLKEWAQNFDAHWETIHNIDPKRFDEKFRRASRIYLHLCSEAFLDGSLRLYQVTFSKGLTSEYPMTRDFLYEQS